MVSNLLHSQSYLLPTKLLVLLKDYCKDILNTTEESSFEEYKYKTCTLKKLAALLVNEEDQDLLRIKKKLLSHLEKKNKIKFRNQFVGDKCQ